MKARDLFRTWRGVAAEALGSLLLVLVLYWLFMLFLYAIFPYGTPLKEIMESGREPESRRYQGERHPDATLSNLFRDVRYRRGNSVAWGGARAGMQLYSQDAVQTFDRSGARISFDLKDQLEIGSNSLILVTRLKEYEDEGAKSYRVKVDGEVHGTLSAKRELRMEFEAAGHLARIGPGAASFRVSPNGRHSASLAIFAGEARVLEKGRTVRVAANYGVALTKGVAVGRPVPLPAAPAATAPERELYRYRLLPPKLRFAWSGARADYHFQLSDGPGFRSCLIDRRVASPEFVTGLLGEGTYYWRVSRLDRGVEGHFSRVGRCRLIQVLDAPALTVNFPSRSAPDAPYLVTGEADPESRVFFDGNEVPVAASGAFRREVDLKPGVNLIRVEALDPAGNASYRSRIVYRSPDGRVRLGGAPRSEKEPTAAKPPPLERQGRGGEGEQRRDERQESGS